MSSTQTIKQNLKTIRDWIRYGATCFETAKLFYGHGTDNAWDEAAALVLHELSLSHELGAKIIDCRLTALEKNKILAAFEQRIVKRLPVPYITNKAFYAGFEFYVDERVLIPRSPIAELFENHFSPWIDAENVCSILDIGTGSACLPIIAAYYFPDASIDAVDIDPQALKVGQINLEKYQLQNQITLIESDLFASLGDKTYDVIITNPPYVDAEDMAGLPMEFHHEPRHALAAGEDGLEHMRQILVQAKRHLNPGGILIGEVGNSSEALEIAYPDIDFTWLEFERGGDGVFLLHYEQLQ